MVRNRRRIEGRLDKVERLVRNRERVLAVHPRRWPDHVRKCWVDAHRQLLTFGVNWVVVYPDYDASVEINGQQMRVNWGDISVDAGLDVPKGMIGFSGPIQGTGWRTEMDP